MFEINKENCKDCGSDKEPTCVKEETFMTELSTDYLPFLCAIVRLYENKVTKEQLIHKALHDMAKKFAPFLDSLIALNHLIVNRSSN